MSYYRKKPVVIEAVRYGPYTAPSVELMVHMEGSDCKLRDGAIFIKTLEGEMRADVGDWIIRGVKGELYPCKDDIFNATYEQVL